LYGIRDIARLASVSVATVSAVINGKGKVSAELTSRVQQAMQALDYHPNHLARSLRVRRTFTIGMMIPDVTNPFFTDVMSGVQQQARLHGYSLIFCDANEDPELECQHLKTLCSRRVDGVLLAPTDSETAQDRATRERFPLVFFDRIPAGFKGSAVITDNFEGAHSAANHLITLGHERIAIITGRLNLSNGSERLEGFRQALQEARLPLSQEYLRLGDFGLESGYRCALELMTLPTPPSAVFSCNNQMTLGLMRALRELDIPCPRRVSVVGFDDFDWAASFSPRLTTIAQPSYEMGKQAMALLMEKIEARINDAVPSDDRVLRLTNELRIRESTAQPCA
jgi:LacI family transcriptional regulator